MKNLTVTQMNKNIANGKNVNWSMHACKESALAGRTKKLAPKVNAIVKEMDLDPDAVEVEFQNIKPSGLAMFDSVKLSNEDFSIMVEFHNATKDAPTYVRMSVDNATDHDEVECESWKELKSILSEYTSYTESTSCEDCDNDPEEECDENCEECEECDNEQVETEEEEEVEEIKEEEEEEEEPSNDEFEDED